MIEVRYKDNFEVADIAGHSVAEARRQYYQGFNLNHKAAAFLNGKKINAVNEAKTVLNDDDKLQFKAGNNHRVAFLVGALLLAIIITGGVFAYGFTNATTTLTATGVNTDFASVSANTSSPVTWTARGLLKGQTGSGTLFDIDTATSGYPGDLTATVMLANADDLVKVYRMLTLVLEVRDSSNNIVDINGDSLADSNDIALLTMENGSATFSIIQPAADVYTVKVKSGAFVGHLNAGWTPGSAAPMLFCEVAQR